MGGDDELCAGACLPKTVHDQLQGLRVQAVVDLLDAGQSRWVGIVEEREEAEQTNGSERRVLQGGGAPQALFVYEGDDERGR